MNSVEIRFHGAAGTVTGSCFELRTNDTRVLIDCGMFQGTRSLEALTLNGKGHV
jgi:metallo-beta-lactamase family protein